MKEIKFLDKRAPETFDSYSPEVITVCNYCNGVAPCWCPSHAYKEQWEFVYKAMKNCKGS